MSCCATFGRILAGPKLNNLASRLDVSGVEFYACSENPGRGVNKLRYLEIFKENLFFQVFWSKMARYGRLVLQLPGHQTELPGFGTRFIWCRILRLF